MPETLGPVFDYLCLPGTITKLSLSHTPHWLLAYNKAVGAERKMTNTQEPRDSLSPAGHVALNQPGDESRWLRYVRHPQERGQRGKKVDTPAPWEEPSSLILVPKEGALPGHLPLSSTWAP